MRLLWEAWAAVTDHALGPDTSAHRICAAWIAIGIGLITLASMLLFHRHRFDWSLELIAIPALPLMAGLVLAGVLFTLLLPLLRATDRTHLAANRTLLALVIAIGLLLRLMMLPTEPALEDDQQRYLWEGALAANGISPYRVAPDDGKAADRGSLLGKLAAQSGPVIERVNHPGLKSIYPPMAQAVFVLAYRISPFNLTAWRFVLLAADSLTLWLLLRLMADAGRSPLWISLYWWNPLVLKEVFNSGHMEGVLVPFLVLAVLLAARRRYTATSGALGLAIGVKIWPILLAPLLFRPLLAEPRRAIGPALMLVGLSAIWAWPIVAGGLDHRSGFVAYAGDWQANSALLPALRDVLGLAMESAGWAATNAGRIARLALAVMVGAVALWLGRTALRDTQDLIERVALLTLVLLLVSPAQFPWYALWTLPFLPFAPRLGVMALAVTMPIYYASFYFAAIGRYEVFRDRIVWIVWLPIWGLLILEAWRGRTKRRNQQSSQAASRDLQN